LYSATNKYSSRTEFVIGETMKYKVFVQRSLKKSAWGNVELMLNYNITHNLVEQFVKIIN